MLPASCARRLVLARRSSTCLIPLLSIMPKKRSVRAMTTAVSMEPPPESTGDALSSAINDVAESADVLSRRFSSRIRAKQVEIETNAQIEPDTVTVTAGDDAELSPLSALEEEEEPPKKKRKRAKKNTEPEVYEIEPVETKTTTWRGTRMSSSIAHSALMSFAQDAWDMRA